LRIADLGTPNALGYRRTFVNPQSAIHPEDMMAPLSFYFILSTLLFTIGAVGFLIRKNPLIMFMSIELMLNAANLSFASFARQRNILSGQVIAFFVIAVAAAEVVVGLAIIVSIFRSRLSVDVDDLNALKG